jgi:peptide/nickel transport system substrate-binding protein
VSVLAGSLLVASWSAVSADPRHQSSHVVSDSRRGGTAYYSMIAGNKFNWILPYPTEAALQAAVQTVAYEMYPPLYYLGDGTKPELDFALSLADPPQYSDGNRVVTIRLKHLKWSNGTPITSRDVEFAMNLYRANAATIGYFNKGEFPQDVTSFSYPNSYEVVLHLNAPYNPVWFTNNALSQIFPMPQASWEKESSSSPVRNYDTTTAGAKAVWKFLSGQAADLSTYGSNPLWRVVDGPWRLTTYNAATGETTLSPNTAYTGPQKKPILSHVVIERFTSPTSEVDQLLSGSLDWGWLPFDDLGVESRLSSEYRFVPWYVDADQWIEFNYTGPYGPIDSQLYIRRALQHLTDNSTYTKSLLHGYATTAYSPVPNLPGSAYATSQDKKDPYPYSVSGAKKLLTQHGWGGSGKTLVCEHPGTGSSDCGKGIALHQNLDLRLIYQNADPVLEGEVEAIQHAAQEVGMAISLSPESLGTLYSIGGICPPGPCDYALAAYSNYYWGYGVPNVFPSDELIFGKGNFWGGGYYSAKAQALIAKVEHESALTAFYQLENLYSKQVVGLWLPTAAYEVIAVKKSLSIGPVPSFVTYYFNLWHFDK